MVPLDPPQQDTHLASEIFHPIHRTPGNPSRGRFSVEDSDKNILFQNEVLGEILDYLNYRESEAQLETIRTLAAIPDQDLCSARKFVDFGSGGSWKVKVEFMTRGIRLICTGRKCLLGGISGTEKLIEVLEVYRGDCEQV